jgi:hypothetical protein
MNKKTLFLVITLTAMLILVTSVNAATDNTNTSTTHSISEKTTTTEPVVKEVQKQEKSPKKQATKNKEKIIKENKTEKQTKTTTKTIEVTDGQSLSDAMTLVKVTETWDECIINLNEGTYDLTGKPPLANSGGNTKTIIINGNNQTITNDQGIGSRTNYELIFNNVTIYTSGLFNEGGTITINNTNLYPKDYFGSESGNTIICDNSNVHLSDSTDIYVAGGYFFTNNTNLIQKLKNGGATDENIVSGGGEAEEQNKTIENTTINTLQINNINLTLINCNLSAKITNNGNLTLVNCSLSNNNIIDSLIENKGSMTLIGCIIENNTGNGDVISSTANLVMDNSTIFNNTCEVICVPNINENININLSNNKFKDNNNAIVLNKSASEAIINIKDNTFDKSNIESKFNSTNIENNNFTDTKINIDNNFVFGNNKIKYNIFNNTNITSPYLEAYNNTFYGGWLSGSDEIDISQYGTNYLKVYNNNFNNANLFVYCTKTDYSMGLSGMPNEQAVMNNSIHNNIFNGKTDYKDVISVTYPQYNTFTNIYDNTYIKTSINDKIIYEENLRLYVEDNITFQYIINNPSYYDQDIQDRVTYDIYIDNEIYKTNTHDNTITLTNSGEHTITITPNISSTTFTKTVTVLPKSDIIITPENYNQYINNGELTRVNENDRILFQGEFTDKGEIFITTDDIVLDGKDAHFTNTNFILEAQYLVIQNMKIENINNNEPAINNTKKNNYILNNRINVSNTEGLTTAIKNIADNTQIKNNELYIDGPAKTIDYNTGGKSNTQAILIIGANKNTIQNNTIIVTTTTPSEEFGTIEGITAHGITNTIITENKINVSNAKFSYGINSLNDVTDNTITENNITVTSYRYCDGIQVGNNAENILIENNNINLHCHNNTPVDEEAIAYGIITTNMGQSTSTKINIFKNNITINSTVGYGIEIYQTTQTEIRNNNILVTGIYSMGIGFAHSPRSTVQGNTITITGDSTQTIKQVTEEIQPENVGIKVQQNSNNIEISDGWVWGERILGANNIHTNDKGGQDWCVNVEDSTQVQVVGNNMVCSNGRGDNAIKNNTELIPNYDRSNFMGITYTNIYINMPTETIIETTIPIEISITDEYGKTIVGGGDVPLNNTITLTINDQNITFTIKDETYTYNYTPNNTGTIQVTATYDGFDILHFNATTTTKTLTVNPKPESHTNTTTENLTLGDSTTLTATFIDDNDQLITSGKVIFKVNGKTLRDNNGNVIYTEIVDGQATLPNVNITQEWMKPDTTIQAVYVGDNNNNPITTKPTNINVTKPEATITIEAPTEATAGTTITLKANVTDGDKQINSGRVAFKLNGKTLKNAEGQALYANVENGIATLQYTIPEKTKAKTYNLTAVFTDTAYDRKESSAELVVAKA